MTDDYRAVDWGDFCPICNGTLTCCGEVMRVFPPGSVAEIYVCDDNANHHWLKVDGEFMEQAP